MLTNTANNILVSGAFLIPFLLMMILIGLPLFFLELYIGQYTSLGPLKAFAAIGPFFSGLGYCTLVVISLISIYYMIIVAWTLFYTIVSIAGNLDWGSCENEFNTDCKLNTITKYIIRCPMSVRFLYIFYSGGDKKIFAYKS